MRPVRMPDHVNRLSCLLNHGDDIFYLTLKVVLFDRSAFTATAPVHRVDCVLLQECATHETPCVAIVQ